VHTIDGIPDMTLGWGVLEWCTNHLGHPDGEHMGDPWIFSPEQARFVLWFYAVDQDRPVLLPPCPAGTLQRMGEKSPYRRFVLC